MFSHLYNHWKSDLEQLGLNNNDLKIILKYCLLDIRDWIEDRITWEQLIEKIEIELDEFLKRPIRKVKALR